MKTRLSVCALSLLTVIGLASVANAGVVGISSQLSSTLIGQHGHQTAYIWSVELYSQCSVHGTTLYGRYFVTCDLNGNYLDYGGLDYGCDEIRNSGRTPVIANQVFWRETDSW